MKYLITSLSFLTLFTATMANAAAAGLSGYWLHESQPVVVQIQQLDDSSAGVITQQADKPQAIGKTLFSNLRSVEGKNEWQGQVYSFKLKEHKDASFVLLDPDHLEMTVKVGFFSKSFQWSRVSADHRVK